MVMESFCGFLGFSVQQKTSLHPLRASPDCAEQLQFRLSNQRHAIAAPGTLAVAYRKQARVQTPNHTRLWPLSSGTLWPVPVTKLASRVSHILAIRRMRQD